MHSWGAWLPWGKVSQPGEGEEGGKKGWFSTAPHLTSKPSGVFFQMQVVASKLAEAR